MYSFIDLLLSRLQLLSLTQGAGANMTTYGPTSAYGDASSVASCEAHCGSPSSTDWCSNEEANLVS